jgi:hypothetical protein
VSQREGPHNRPIALTPNILDTRAFYCEAMQPSSSLESREAFCQNADVMGCKQYRDSGYCHALDAIYPNPGCKPDNNDKNNFPPRWIGVGMRNKGIRRS